VIGQDRQGRIMQFDMAKGRSADPEAFVEREWGKGGQVQNVQPLRLRSGLDAAAGFAQVQVNKRPAEAMLVAIEAGEEGQFYRFMFADTRGLDRGDVGDFEAAAGSFQRLSKDDASAFRPLRIEIHTVRSGESQEDVARLMEVEQLPLETFRVINGLEEGQELRPGEAVKVIVRG
jgi:predicted Zn-dependent protease